MNASSNSPSDIVGNVDRTFVKRNPSDNTLLVTVEGWILHPEQEIVDLYFETARSSRVQTTRLRRPDIAQSFPDLPYAILSGYSIQLELEPQNLLSPLPLIFFATLTSGHRINATIGAPIDLSQAVANPIPLPTLDTPNNALKQITLRTFLSSGETLRFPRTSAITLSVVVVTYNRAAETLACLSALLQQATDKIEIIIVDNASSDLTSQLLQRIEGARILKNNENLHFLSAARQGAVVASGEIILFLNNDAHILGGALHATIDSFRNHPRLGVVGARLVHAKGTLQEVGGTIFADGSNIGNGVGEHPLAVPFLMQQAVDYCSGAFLATPRALWEQLGGFDLRYLPAYYEDVDYCFAAREKGYQVIVEPRIVVIHQEGAITDNAEEAKALMLRNREKFRQKHAAQIGTLKATHGIRPIRASLDNILIIDDFFPIRENGQGAPRTKLIVETLVALGYRITLVALGEGRPLPADHQNDFPRDRVSLLSLSRGDALLEFLALNGASFGQIIISRPHNMEEFQSIRTRYAICAENAQIIYDAEAIFALREIRKKQLELGHSLSESEVERIVSQEVLTVQKAHQFWCVSLDESRELLKRGLENVHVLGFGAAVTDKTAPANDRSGLLFVAPILDADSPNGQGFIWYVNHVVPLLHTEIAANTKKQKQGVLSSLFKSAPRAPSIQLNHVGLNILHGSVALDWITFNGQVKDTALFYECARVFIAPIFFGSGIPLKVIEAAAHGVPIVATPYLAEQLGWSNEVEILVAGTPEQFSKQIVRLLTDDSLWNKLQKNARIRIERDFSTAAFRRVLGSLVLPVG